MFVRYFKMARKQFSHRRPWIISSQFRLQFSNDNNNNDKENKSNNNNANDEDVGNGGDDDHRKET